MKSQIQNKLSAISNERNLNILFACESGSRAWGFSSVDSDYDIRFIYTHPQDWYLSINDKRDLIDLPIEDNLDFGGWELRKALRLFHKSNPVIFEWLQSPIQYNAESELRETLWAIRETYFSPRAGIHHYVGLTKKSFKTILESEKPKLKTYFYVIRPLCAALWIAQKRTVPPMTLQELLPIIESDKKIIKTIEELIAKKEESSEKDRIEPLITLHNFVESSIYELNGVVQTIDSPNPNMKPLNELFRKFLGVKL